MNKVIVLACTAIFLASSQVSANTLVTPDFVKLAAKYAKLKAKQRSIIADIEDGVGRYENQISQAITQRTGGDSESCDLNVGNVIIEGDIFQSNDCR